MEINLLVQVAHHLERRVVIGAKVRKTWLPVYRVVVNCKCSNIYAVSILLFIGVALIRTRLEK